MKKFFLLIVSIIAIGCNGNLEKTNSENVEQKKFNYLGDFIWEGKRDIGYGMSANMKITQSIIGNGKDRTIEFVKETGETKTDEIQYYIDKDNSIVFGKFNTPNPDGNTPGAMYIMYPSGDDLISSGSKNLYKRVN